MPDEFILRYFGAEKQESLLFLGVGLGAFIAAWLLWRHSPRYRGMIGPLVAIAAIQIVVGGTVFLRTDAQVVALQRQFATAPASFKLDEGRRMAGVMRNFGIYKAIEAALLGFGLALAAGLRRRPGWHAFGIGLALQAGFMLVLDGFAEGRGQTYLDAVLRL